MKMRVSAALAFLWLVFASLWAVLAVYIGATVAFVRCGGLENTSDDVVEGAPRDRYCDAVYAFFDRPDGDPLEPLPYVLPFVVLLVLGGLAIWRRSKRALAFLGAGAAAVVAVHVGLLLLLPAR